MFCLNGILKTNIVIESLENILKIFLKKAQYFESLNDFESINDCIEEASQVVYKYFNFVSFILKQIFLKIYDETMKNYETSSSKLLSLLKVLNEVKKSYLKFDKNTSDEKT